jgi:hypothetical protein
MGLLTDVAGELVRLTSEAEMRAEWSWLRGVLTPLPGLLQTRCVVDDQVLLPERLVFAGGIESCSIAMLSRIWISLWFDVTIAPIS